MIGSLLAPEHESRVNTVPSFAILREHPMPHNDKEAVTLTNDTVVNQVTFCALLDRIAAAYADSGLPVTLVLDNARYQKCRSVFDKADTVS